MMKNILFLQALLLSSINMSAAAEESKLRGALKEQEDVAEGVRDLRKSLHAQLEFPRLCLF